MLYAEWLISKVQTHKFNTQPQGESFLAQVRVIQLEKGSGAAV